MSRKIMFDKTFVAAALILTYLGAGLGKAPAQDSNGSNTTPEQKTIHAYRIDFSVNEFEDGKKINSRQYSMESNANDSNEMKIGTKIPVEARQGEFEYIDVGTSISCRLQERANGLSMWVKAEVSNFAKPDSPGDHPVLRQLSIQGSTLVQLGKLVVVGSEDDPNSKRTFQLEVTVNSVK
jgi:hypothetical protein